MNRVRFSLAVGLAIALTWLFEAIMAGNIDFLFSQTVVLLLAYYALIGFSLTYISLYTASLVCGLIKSC